MSHIFWAANAICWLALLTAGQVQANPTEPQEKPAVADDDSPPPPRKGEKPGQGAEKTLTATGVVASISQESEGRCRWICDLTMERKCDFRRTRAKS